MKYIIIDDNKSFAEALCRQLNGTCNEGILRIGEVMVTGETFFEYTTSEIAGAIIQSYSSDPNGKKRLPEDRVIFINVNLKTRDGNRQEQKGVELLKWLRLKGCNNHVILYSFQSFLQILKDKPLNSIIHSKGVSFIQLPFAISEIQQLNASEKADKQNLLPFFRAEVDLEGIRHELANIWGLKRLKWAINAKYNEDKSNYKISLLNFLNGESIGEDTTKLKGKLTTLVNWFTTQNPSIYYYDDMAKDWGAVLKTVFGTNFKYYTPQEKSQEDLIKELTTKRPKCLLLDLRLENEKTHYLDPIKLSGGKLLVDIKRKYFSLPVIMFTATNKAESVRRLLASGAEYVWTKEGIDDGVDDVLTLQNTIDLLQKIKTCVFKFQNQVYEDIYEAESKISNTFGVDNSIKNVLENDDLKDYKTIVFDSNLLIDGLKYKGGLLRIYKALLTNSKLDSISKKKVIIHDDIYYELFRISKFKEVKNDSNDDFRVPVAKFLIKQLYNWRKSGLLWIDGDFGQQDAIKEAAGYDIDLTPIERIELEEKTFFEKITELFNTRQRIEIDEINKRIDEINSGIKSIPNLKKLKLHFDDTLKELIPKYLTEGGVLLVTNDNTCAYNVGKLFLFGTNQEKHTYNCKLNPNNKNEVTRKEGIKSATIDNYTYKHMLNGEFHQLFLRTTK